MDLQQLVGAGLMLLFLADIFLTVLYARAGTGLFAARWNRFIWAVVLGASRLSGRYRATILSLAGPLIVVALIGVWALGLTIGAALIVHPELGTAVRPSSGASSTDFVTALMVAGNSLSIVGGGDYSPHTSATRILFLVNSLIGASVLSLVLSYLVQVYSALRERNALALTVELMTAGTGDAAEMLARLGPNGKFTSANSELSNVARSLAMTKEAHHFYPLLFYFRFEDPLYSVSRMSFILLDLTTLIEAALDRNKYGVLVRSVAVQSLHRCARLLLATLDQNFPTVDEKQTLSRTAVFEASYAAALAVLRNAGIETKPDAERYAYQRSQWEPLVRRVGPALGYGMDEIDCRRPLKQAATFE
ncbi:ion channel [Neorhizobium sp. DAR64860/K0K1]|uniref:ion channel n=1 Tax=Neorhizobium sp. DAR64860/K0K1 TaxID=3421955 RepID=UPI003D2E9A51